MTGVVRSIAIHPWHCGPAPVNMRIARHQYVVPRVSELPPTPAQPRRNRISSGR